MSENLSLINGLRILLLYNTKKTLLTVSQISKILGYSKSKTYRLVKTLTNYNFLQKKTGTKQYALGLNILRVGLIGQQTFELSSIVRPLMEELCHLTKETVFLSSVNGTKRMLLDKVESDEPIRYSELGVGELRPLTIGASSKLLLAYLPEEDWDSIISNEGLKRYTPYTIMDANKLKKQLKEIRKKGYAYSDREEIAEVRGVAAPIRNNSGKVLAALSIGGPVYRINKKRLNELIKLVVKYADKISKDTLWGFTPLPS
jgi:DNA-binding IclR family transcriptional regulator